MYTRITTLLALATYLVTYLVALDFSVRSELMEMEQTKESQNNISARPRQVTPQFATHSPGAHSSLPTYFQGALPIHPSPRYKPYSTYRFPTALPSLCRERKPEEKATQKSSPFNSEPSWSHIQPAGQPEFATNLPPPVYFQGVLPIHPFDFYRTNSTSQFPTALPLPSPCAEPNPEQKAAREEGIPKVNDFQTQPDGSSPLKTSSVGKIPPLPTVIDTSDFLGEFNFEILFEDEKLRPAKYTPWTFSPSLGKLFAKINSMVPIAVRLKVYPSGYYVRLVAVFKESEHRLKTVQTCANHRSNQSGDHAPQHLVRCVNPKTLYVTCPVTMRHCLVIPLEAPQAGCDFVTNMFHFMCFNSCSGGPNRRPILVVFTLEHDNILVGRKVIEVRVCACPGRDRTREEAKSS